MQKTKILYLITSLDTLGPATALVNIANRLNPDLFQVQFCCCDSGHRGPLQSALSDNNIPIHTLNTIGPLDIRAILKLVKLLNREKFDILHSRLPRADFYARLAGALSDVPIVVNNICDIYTAHFQTWHHPFVGKLYYWSNKLTIQLADFYVANANGVRDDLIQNVGIPSDKVFRIYNGIDSKRFNVNQEVESQTRSQLGLADDALVVGTIAKLNRKKGLHDLLKSAGSVIKKHREIVFFIVGEGPAREELLSLKDSLGLGNSVRFLGHRSDIPELLSIMNIFVFPSYFEGHPNSLLEALSAGVPTVATDVPGNNEVVIDGETGSLVPAKSPSRLADAILNLLEDAPQRERYRAAGKLSVNEKFSPERMGQEFECFYESCLKSRISS